MATIADLIAEARVLNQDEDVPYRDDDTKYVQCVNRALQELNRLRPDAFYDTFDGLDTVVPTYTTGTVNSTFPVPMLFWAPVLYFVVGSIQLKDDEFVADGRAVTLMKQFEAKVQSQQ